MLFRMQENVSTRVKNFKIFWWSMPWNTLPLAEKKLQLFQNITRLLLETTHLYQNLMKPLWPSVYQTLRYM